MARIPPEVVDEVLERAANHCEACGWPMHGKADLHHRKARSQGGRDTVENLLWVHSDCHTVSPWAIHQNPTRSHRLGHVLYAIEDPALVGFTTTLDLRVLRA